MKLGKIFIESTFDDLVKSLRKNGKVKSSPAFRGARRAIPRSAGQMDFLRSNQNYPIR